jgi:hypothetical protein
MACLKLRLLRLLALAVVAPWFLCPLPRTSAIKTIDVERPGSPSSAVVEERTVCTRASDEIRLRLSDRSDQSGSRGMAREASFSAHSDRAKGQPDGARAEINSGRWNRGDTW